VLFTAVQGGTGETMSMVIKGLLKFQLRSLHKHLAVFKPENYLPIKENVALTRKTAKRIENPTDVG